MAGRKSAFALMKRPLGWVIIYLALGIILGDVLSLAPAVWLAIAFPTWFFCLLKGKARQLTLPLLLVVVGATNIAIHNAIVSPLDLRDQLNPEAQLLKIRGTIERVELRESDRDDGTTGFRTNARVRASGFQRGSDSWQPAYGALLATAPIDATKWLHVGQEVSIFGICKLPPQAFARGMFDYRQYLARHGIYFEIEFESRADVDVTKESPLPWSRRFRAWAAGVLQRGLPQNDPAVGALQAIALGQRTALTDEMEEPFMRSGTMHLFAISGLHVGLVAGIMVALLRLLRIPREGVGWIVIPSLWFFAAVTGWQPSAVRATIMMSIVVLGWSLHRPIDLLNSLAAAAFLILLGDPRELFHAGFQLSFAVVASIAVLLPPLERLRQRIMRTDPLLPLELRPRWQQLLDGPARLLTMSLAVSVAAWAGSLPLIMLYFHLITPVSLIANLVIVQLGSLALASALGALICAPVAPFLTDLFNHSAWFFANAMMAGSRWFSDLPMAAFNTKAPPLITLICYYALLWVWTSGWGLRWRRTGSLISLGLALVGWFGWHQAYSRPSLAVLPLNGGHALFLENPGRQNWLIDCGDNNNWRYRVRPFLQTRGVNRLDSLVLTHGDVRHAGAATNAVSEFAPRHIYLNPLPQRSMVYRDFEELAKNFNLPISRPVAGARLGPWTVLHPTRDDPNERADSTALVMKLDLGGACIVHIPDLDRDGWPALVGRQSAMQTDVVIASPAPGGKLEPSKIGHAFDPQALIVVDSEFPASDRVSDASWKAIEALGCDLFSTARDGSIEIRFGNDEITIDSSAGESIELSTRARQRSIDQQTKLTKR